MHNYKSRCGMRAAWENFLTAGAADNHTHVLTRQFQKPFNFLQFSWKTDRCHTAIRFWKHLLLLHNFMTSRHNETKWRRDWDQSLCVRTVASCARR
jgi:hypothetical protein